MGFERGVPVMGHARRSSSQARDRRSFGQPPAHATSSSPETQKTEADATQTSGVPASHGLPHQNKPPRVRDPRARIEQESQDPSVAFSQESHVSPGYWDPLGSKCWDTESGADLVTDNSLIRDDMSVVFPPTPSPPRARGQTQGQAQAQPMSFPSQAHAGLSFLRAPSQPGPGQGPGSLGNSNPDSPPVALPQRKPGRPQSPKWATQKGLWRPRTLCMSPNLSVSSHSFPSFKSSQASQSPTSPAQPSPAAYSSHLIAPPAAGSTSASMEVPGGAGASPGSSVRSTISAIDAIDIRQEVPGVRELTPGSRKQGHEQEQCLIPGRSREQEHLMTADIRGQDQCSIPAFGEWEDGEAESRSFSGMFPIARRGKGHAQLAFPGFGPKPETPEVSPGYTQGQGPGYTQGQGPGYTQGQGPGYTQLQGQGSDGLGNRSPRQVDPHRPRTFAAASNEDASGMHQWGPAGMSGMHHGGGGLGCGVNAQGGKDASVNTPLVGPTGQLEATMSQLRATGSRTFSRAAAPSRAKPLPASPITPLAQESAASESQESFSPVTDPGSSHKGSRDKGKGKPGSSHKDSREKGKRKKTKNEKNLALGGNEQAGESETRNPKSRTSEPGKGRAVPELPDAAVGTPPPVWDSVPDLGLGGWVWVRETPGGTGGELQGGSDHEGYWTPLNYVMSAPQGTPLHHGMAPLQGTFLLPGVTPPHGTSLHTGMATHHEPTGHWMPPHRGMSAPSEVIAHHGGAHHLEIAHYFGVFQRPGVVQNPGMPSLGVPYGAIPVISQHPGKAQHPGESQHPGMIHNPCLLHYPVVPQLDATSPQTGAEHGAPEHGAASHNLAAAQHLVTLHHMAAQPTVPSEPGTLEATVPPEPRASEGTVPPKSEGRFLGLGLFSALAVRPKAPALVRPRPASLPRRASNPHSSTRISTAGISHPSLSRRTGNPIPSVNTAVNDNRPWVYPRVAMEGGGRVEQCRSVSQPRGFIPQARTLDCQRSSEMFQNQRLGDPMLPQSRAPMPPTLDQWPAHPWASTPLGNIPSAEHHHCVSGAPHMGHHHCVDGGPIVTVRQGPPGADPPGADPPGAEPPGAGPPADAVRSTCVRRTSRLTRTGSGFRMKADGPSGQAGQQRYAKGKPVMSGQQFVRGSPVTSRAAGQQRHARGSPVAPVGGEGLPNRVRHPTSRCFRGGNVWGGGHMGGQAASVRRWVSSGRDSGEARRGERSNAAAAAVRQLGARGQFSEPQVGRGLLPWPVSTAATMMGVHHSWLASTTETHEAGEWSTFTAGTGQAGVWAALGSLGTEQDGGEVGQLVRSFTHVDRVNHAEMDRVNNTDMDRVNHADVDRVNNTGMDRVNHADVDRVNNTDMERVNHADVNRINHNDMDKVSHTEAPLVPLGPWQAEEKVQKWLQSEVARLSQGLQDPRAAPLATEAAALAAAETPSRDVATWPSPNQGEGVTGLGANGDPVQQDSLGPAQQTPGEQEPQACFESTQNSVHAAQQPQGQQEPQEGSLEGGSLPVTFRVSQECPEGRGSSDSCRGTIPAAKVSKRKGRKEKKGRSGKGRARMPGSNPRLDTVLSRVKGSGGGAREAGGLVLMSSSSSGTDPDRRPVASSCAPAAVAGDGPGPAPKAAPISGPFPGAAAAAAAARAAWAVAQAPSAPGAVHTWQVAVQERRRRERQLRRQLAAPGQSQLSAPEATFLSQLSPPQAQHGPSSAATGLKSGGTGEAACMNKAGRAGERVSGMTPPHREQVSGLRTRLPVRVASPEATSPGAGRAAGRAVARVGSPGKSRGSRSRSGEQGTGDLRKAEGGQQEHASLGATPGWQEQLLMMLIMQVEDRLAPQGDRLGDRLAPAGNRLGDRLAPQGDKQPKQQREERQPPRPSLPATHPMSKQFPASPRLPERHKGSKGLLGKKVTPKGAQPLPQHLQAKLQHEGGEKRDQERQQQQEQQDEEQWDQPEEKQKSRQVDEEAADAHWSKHRLRDAARETRDLAHSNAQSFSKQSSTALPESPVHCSHSTPGIASPDTPSMALSHGLYSFVFSHRTTSKLQCTRLAGLHFPSVEESQRRQFLGPGIEESYWLPGMPLPGPGTEEKSNWSGFSRSMGGTPGLLQLQPGPLSPLYEGPQGDSNGDGRPSSGWSPWTPGAVGIGSPLDSPGVGGDPLEVLLFLALGPEVGWTEGEAEGGALGLDNPKAEKAAVEEVEELALEGEDKDQATPEEGQDQACPEQAGAEESHLKSLQCTDLQQAWQEEAGAEEGIAEEAAVETATLEEAALESATLEEAASEEATLEEAALEPAAFEADAFETAFRIPSLGATLSLCESLDSAPTDITAYSTKGGQLAARLHRLREGLW